MAGLAQVHFVFGLAGEKIALGKVDLGMAAADRVAPEDTALDMVAEAVEKKLDFP